MNFISIHGYDKALDIGVAVNVKVRSKDQTVHKHCALSVLVKSENFETTTSFTFILRNDQLKEIADKIYAVLEKEKETMEKIQNPVQQDAGEVEKNE